MKKKIIKLIALKSFARNNLDPIKVKKFSKSMKRKDLRQYIKYLKHYESKNKITIVIPSMEKINKKDLGRFAKLYPNKKIEYLEDPSIILGIRLIDNDLIYDFNLKNTFENITQQI